MKSIKYNLKKISDYEWEIIKKGDMNVPGKIFASKKLLEQIEKDETINQIINVSKIPGILKYSIALPDAHQGYGMCIGGVAAFDIEKGVISPGMVGFDINCGVRISSVNISVKDFIKKKEKIIKEIFKEIPTGLGKKSNKISKNELKEILVKGSGWAIKNKKGIERDLIMCEENGCIKNSDFSKVSDRAISRGLNQLGTLGSGNHFIEIQKIEKIYNQKVADVFGLNKNNIYVMIHCGSRGLGHQVASDYIQLFIKENPLKIKNKELASALFKSNIGQDYFNAMNCSANFAFCNRQIIMNKIRNIFQKNFLNSNLSLIYDVAHNIARIEEFETKKGVLTKACVHRKGATRTLGSGDSRLPKDYLNTGQPVIIPGSMGTYSYILVGTNNSKNTSFSSTAHGAGRLESRLNAKKNINLIKVQENLKKQNILLLSNSFSSLSEEAPEAYKDVDEVVNVSNNLKIGQVVAKLKPLAVIKG